MLQKSLNVPDVFLQNFRCCFEKKIHNPNKVSLKPLQAILSIFTFP